MRSTINEYLFFNKSFYYYFCNEKKYRYETDIFFYYLNKNLKFTLIFDKENFLNISVIYLKNVNILTKINQKK